MTRVTHRASLQAMAGAAVVRALDALHATQF
jgi:hypothetical protein